LQKERLALQTKWSLLYDKGAYREFIISETQPTSCTVPKQAHVRNPFSTPHRSALAFTTRKAQKKEQWCTTTFLCHRQPQRCERRSFFSAQWGKGEGRYLNLTSCFASFLFSLSEPPNSNTVCWMTAAELPHRTRSGMPDLQ